MKRRHITAFYLETLILIVVFIGIILVLTRVFGMSKNESMAAELLTKAVYLSENAAEVISASGSPEEAALLLNEADNAQYLENEHRICAFYAIDGTPDPEGALALSATWEPSQKDSGILVGSHIIVQYEAGEEPVYTLDTATFLKEAAP